MPLDEASESLTAKLKKYTYSPTTLRSSEASSEASTSRSATLTPVRSPSTPIRSRTRNEVPPRSGGGGSGSAQRRRRSPKDVNAEEKTDNEEYLPRTTPVLPGMKRIAKPPNRGEGSGKKPRPYADPEVYAHLKPVSDHLEVGLDIVFCGINPGKVLWRAIISRILRTSSGALYESGLTPRRYSPAEDYLLPQLHKFGLTNLCGRPTAEQSELSTLEMKLNVLPFTRKLRDFRPRVVCFVGKKIWDVYESVAMKTASAVSISSSGIGGDGRVKVEEGEEGPLVKLDPDLDVELSSDRTPDRAKRKRTAAPTTPKVRVPFDWTKPRSLRLPLISSAAVSGDVKVEETDGKPDLEAPGQQYCYFWVVPNTSGLERTPLTEQLAEQIILFSHLKVFSDALRAGDPPEGIFFDIDVAGLERTTNAIKASAEVPKTPKAPSGKRASGQ